MNRIDEYAQLGAKIGAEIGNKLLARINEREAKSAPSKPSTFHGGVAIASFSAREAETLVEHEELGIGVIGEYAQDAEVLAEQGITLERFARLKYSEVHGSPLAGLPSNMPADLRSAFQKQSEIFSARFGNGRQA